MNLRFIYSNLISRFLIHISIHNFTFSFLSMAQSITLIQMFSFQLFTPINKTRTLADTRIQPNTPEWHLVSHRIVRSNKVTPSVSSTEPKKVGTQYLIETIRRNIVTLSVSSTRGRSIPELFQSYGMPTISDSARLVNRVSESHFNSINFSYFQFKSFQFNHNLIQYIFHFPINIPSNAHTYSYFILISFNSQFLMFTIQINLSIQ
ncbi:hypothetical protein V6Z11_D07G095000 [Gossypium hirsutum]